MTTLSRRTALQSAVALSAACLTDLRALASEQPPATTKPTEEIAALRSAENPYGPPPAALEAVQAEMRDGYRYPRTKVAEFKELIARDAGVTPEHVLIGAGSIELMLSAGLYYGRRGRTIVAADPTWHTTAEYAEANGAKWHKVPVTADYRYDFPAMLAAVNDDTDLVYICHPNNPTGIAEDPAALESFVKKVSKRTHVMIDEAFIDCLDNGEETSMKRLIATNDKVIIARTFSKLWGMAGFRVGYMIGAPKLMEQFKATIPKLEMQSRLSVAAAMAAYRDPEFLRVSRGRMKKSRSTIYEILDARGLKYVPSDCNFVSFEVPTDAEAYREKMLTRGVALKNVSFLGKQHLRVSCGTPEELQKFKAALA